MATAPLPGLPVTQRGKAGRDSLGAASGRCAIFSPDVARIAFTTDLDGNREIYVMNADGSGPANRTHRHGDDTAPDWGPGAGALPAWCRSPGTPGPRPRNSGPCP